MSDEATEKSPSSETSNKAYWRANLRLMGGLLAIWFVVSYGCGILFVNELDELTCAGMGSICVSLGGISLLASFITWLCKSREEASTRAYSAIVPTLWAIAFILLGIFFNGKGEEPFKLGGFKLGFWFAQQGAIYVFVILIFVYVWQMNKLDHEHGVEE